MGYDTTPCPRPCETFHAQTKFVSELDAKHDNEMTIRAAHSAGALSQNVFTHLPVLGLWRVGQIAHPFLVTIV